MLHSQLECICCLPHDNYISRRLSWWTEQAFRDKARSILFLIPNCLNLTPIWGLTRWTTAETEVLWWWWANPPRRVGAEKGRKSLGNKGKPIQPGPEVKGKWRRRGARHRVEQARAQASASITGHSLCSVDRSGWCAGKGPSSLGSVRVSVCYLQLRPCACTASSRRKSSCQLSHASLLCKGPCSFSRPREGWADSLLLPGTGAAVLPTLSISHVHKPRTLPRKWADLANSFPSPGPQAFCVLIIVQALYRLLSVLSRRHQECRALRDLSTSCAASPRPPFLWLGEMQGCANDIE